MPLSDQGRSRDAQFDCQCQFNIAEKSGDFQVLRVQTKRNCAVVNEIVSGRGKRQNIARPNYFRERIGCRRALMSDVANTGWRDTFVKWPTGIAKRGVVLSTLNEVTPFKSFFIKDNMLLLERTNPDPLGGRFVLMEFSVIHMLKITDPLTEAAILSGGFVGQLAKA
jgi:hypothetical protein